MCEKGRMGPSQKQVFDAMTDDHNPDWSDSVLSSASQEQIDAVNNLFNQGLTSAEVAYTLGFID